VAGIWLIFGQMVLGSVAGLWWWIPMMLEYPCLDMLVLVFPALFFMLIGVTAIASSTRNYVAYRRSTRGLA
jgi:hypothetical protein